MDDSARDLRLSSTMRWVFITGLILVYTWFLKDPGVSLKVTFLIAAGFQFAVIVIRRFVPADELPRAMYIFELIADGVTVLMFAIGVFGALGSIARVEI
jgi:hypothetical protein